MNLGPKIRTAVQRIMRALGYEIRRFTRGEMDRLEFLLSSHKIDTVIDVGANTGQFASALRTAGFTGTIISFEPQFEAHARLVSFANSDPKWIVAPRSAVGAESGEITLNISDNSVSSSALPILDTLASSAPAARYVAQERAPVIRLDDSDLVPADSRIFVKIDTQGFEGEVIKGASKVLARAVGIQTELSIARLYDGQPDYLDILKGLTEMGFEPWSIEPGFADPQNHRLLQIDATFFRPGMARGSAN